MILPIAIWLSLRPFKKRSVWKRQIKYSPLYDVYLLKTSFGSTKNNSFVRTPKRNWKIWTNALLKKKNLPLPSTPPENEFQCVHWIILNLETTFGYRSPSKGLYLQNLNNPTIISQMWRFRTVIFSLSKQPTQHSGIINMYVYFLNTQGSPGLQKRHKNFSHSTLR